MHLTKYQTQGKTRVTDGVTLAPCNNAENKLTVKQIQESRDTPISKEVFTEYMTYLMELHNRQLSKPMIQKMMQKLSENMGNDEFVAACEDALVTRLRFSDLLAFLIEHVQKQREVAPDLMGLDIAEANNANF